MIKVSDLDAARDQVSASGGSIGEIQIGPHERRFLARTPFGTIIFYSPTPAP